MVSLNEKCSILLSIARKELEQHEKEIPKMFQGTVKSFFGIASMLLIVTPEKKLKDGIEKAHHLYESLMVAEHQNSEDFKQHVQELLQEWT